MFDFVQRRDKLRHTMREAGVDSMLVTDVTNVTYLTGFTGDSSYLLMQADGGAGCRETLLTDFRYITQLEEECPGLDTHVRKTGVKMTDAVGEVAAKHHARKVAIEAASLTLASYEPLKEKLGEMVSTSGWIDKLREIKDAQEVTEIREAIRIAEAAFTAMRAALRPEQSEKEVADNLEMFIRREGGQCSSFTPIVGVGKRGALPHGRPLASSKIADDTFLLVDWGARGRQYISDLTRVLVTGKISPKLERVHGVVLKAQRTAIEAIRPGAIMKDVDAAARNVIAEAGYGDYFGHSLGHGIGLNVHEQPRLAVDYNRPLEAGMVVTVEPGIYLPDWGGVRLEDDVLVTNDGHEVLSSLPLELADCMVTM